MMKLVDAEALRVELGKCYVTRFEGKLPDGRVGPGEQLSCR